jgi:hypothetical protein
MLAEKLEHVFFFIMYLLKVLLFVLLKRNDMEVLDEPLYAYFLRATGLDRPYREELLSKMVC